MDAENSTPQVWSGNLNRRPRWPFWFWALETIVSSPSPNPTIFKTCRYLKAKLRDRERLERMDELLEKYEWEEAGEDVCTEDLSDAEETSFFQRKADGENSTPKRRVFVWCNSSAEKKNNC